MTDVAIKDRLLAIISQIRQIPVEQIDLSARIDSLNLDSLHIVEIMMLIQSDFDIYLPMDNSLEKIQTVDELLSRLETTIKEFREAKDG